jgi:hypothetical protein
MEFVDTLSDHEKVIFQEKIDETNRIFGIYGKCIFQKENRHLLPCYSHSKETKCNCVFNKKMIELASNCAVEPKFVNAYCI